jgi:hypothetical protein
MISRKLGRRRALQLACRHLLAICASIRLIDRRFYRQKYNAERVLADFSSVLREKVDLNQLTVSILGVVEETLHPDRVSLWLRDIDYEARERQS